MVQSVERKIEEFVAELKNPEIAKLVSQLPSGKRLRAKLILKIAGDSPLVVKTAAIVEMIHAASLLHDDVIDDAYTRRSKPSINALYGNKTAIMLGDILYSKAFFELSHLDSRISKVVSNAVVQLSLGELDDVGLASTFNSNKELYLAMIYQKTASLIEASAEVAAILAGKPPVPYQIYGRNLGLASQMVDDVLDITQKSETLGKPALHDFVEGKTTLPYIYLYEALGEEERGYLVGLHGKPLSSEEQGWIALKFEEHGIIQKFFAHAKSLIDEAIEMMHQEGEDALEAIAREMIEREF